MGVQVANNAYSTLAAGITSTATNITVIVGEGVRFPPASSVTDQYFYATVIDVSNNLEVVKVIDRAENEFTVLRGVDGTTARAYEVGARIELRPTAALFRDLPIRQLQTADYSDASVTSTKLVGTGVVAGNYGGAGFNPSVTVNSKGQITSIAQASGAVQRDVYDFTTIGGSQSWSRPSGGAIVRVQLWGGGGGGARGSSAEGGGGGGGGAYKEAWFDYSELSATATVVVGEGGAGATLDNVEGARGGATTFTSGSVTLIAYRGGGGSANNTAAYGGGGGGEIENGSTAGNATAGKGGAIGGGHGGIMASGVATVGSTARGATAVVTGDIPSTPAHLSNDARSIWGGGGGGGGNVGSVTGSEAAGGYAVWGGGGGSGGYNGTRADLAGLGGKSEFGGKGGDGATASSAAGNGTVPGGGGGGTETGAAGAGGAGRCIVTVY
jgi:hypothetical protein